MEKIINPGKIEGHNIFCKIEWKNNNLSITGVIGPNRNGDSWGGCGQINPVLPDEFSEGWNNTKLETFNTIWENYHLNDLQAACEHQRELGWTYKTHAGKTCPTCGYEIGTKWLRKEVPEWVISYLFALPDSQIKPAWV